MAAKPYALLLASILMAACQSTGGLPADGGNPYAPTGPVRGEDSVDGLIVGHRLMAAGEYDLALRAYYRAAADQGLTVDVLSALGSANLSLGRLGQAEDLLRRAVKEDENFVPAWNNLGVVLMETGEYAEASRVFRTAYALDSGQTDAIRENLRVALAKIEQPQYDAGNTGEFSLVRRGNGQYLLLTTH